MRRNLALGLAAVPLAGAFAVGGLALASASPSLPPGTIHGCVDHQWRVLRHVYTSPNKGLTCPPGTFRIVWARGGLPGPQGPPGSQGLQGAPGPRGPAGPAGPAPTRLFCTPEPGSNVLDCGAAQPAAAPNIAHPASPSGALTGCVLAQSPHFAVGRPQTYTVTATGGPTPSITDGGAVLPAGLTFTDNHDGTATLAGTPAAGTDTGGPHNNGRYPVTFTALNGHAPNSVRHCTLTVDLP